MANQFEDDFFIPPGFPAFPNYPYYMDNDDLTLITTPKAEMNNIEFKGVHTFIENIEQLN
jgi:hypothetical protein